MFTKTTDFYEFKYLTTAISGPGLKGVWLPEQPPDAEILFKEEQKFTRPELPEYLAKEIKKWRIAVESGVEYVSPFGVQIKEWEDQQWKWATEGLWFWNNGQATYLTPFNAWYLMNWEPYFGRPIYRATDMEICYLLLYVEQDPQAFGILLNTIRRYGKSSLMGGWIIYRTTMNKKHSSGMQGEKDDKIAKFYNKMVLKPFKKLPYLFQPTFDTSTKLSTGIKFERRVIAGKRAILDRLESESEDLESELDYRPSGVTEYDGEVLHSFLGEEWGKFMAAAITDLWDVVKPALRKGTAIRGRCFAATTVEFMDVTNKGGRAYRVLFYDSDFDNRGKDGRTISGLYACFLPGDCALEDFLDEWGHPRRAEAKEYILRERDAVRNRPDKYSGLIRKYPLYVSEIFHVNAAGCVFNSELLQNQLGVINQSKSPLSSRVEFYWENNIRFSKVKWRHNPSNGWAHVTWLPDKPEDSNQVDRRAAGNEPKYFPRNELKFAAGVDPVDHTVQIQSSNPNAVKEEMVTFKRSTPVLFVKRKYDVVIDGVLSQEILKQRAEEKFPYQTNKHIVMMDVRTSDPNVYYERALMICWFFGCSIQVETNKPGIKNWFYAANCEGFLQQKYIAESDNKKQNFIEEGTAASSQTINAYTDELSVFIEYFSHTISFRELIEDLLLFKPWKTREHDYAVAAGWTELACKVQPKKKTQSFVDISSIMPLYDYDGNRINPR